MINTTGFNFSPGGGVTTSPLAGVRPPQLTFVNGASLTPDDSEGIRALEAGNLAGAKAIGDGISVAATSFSNGMVKARENSIQEKQFAETKALQAAHYAAEEKLANERMGIASDKAVAAGDLIDLKTQLLQAKINEANAGGPGAVRANAYLGNAKPIVDDGTPPSNDIIDVTEDQMPQPDVTINPPPIATDALKIPASVPPVINSPNVPGASSLATAAPISGPVSMPAIDGPTSLEAAPIATPQPAALQDSKFVLLPEIPGVSNVRKLLDTVTGKTETIPAEMDLSKLNVPEGMYLKGFSTDINGNPRYEFGNKADMDDKKETVKERQSIMRERSVRQEQVAFYNTPAIKNFESAQGPRVAFPKFFADYEDAAAHPDQAGIHDIGMLDMFVRAESGRGVTEGQAHLALDAKNLKDKFAIIFNKQLGGDTLSQGQRDSMLRVIAENYNSGADQANQSVLAARDRLTAQGVTDERALPKPYVLAETKDSAMKKMDDLRSSALESAAALKAAEAENNSEAAAAAKEQWNKIKDEALGLSKRLKNSKSFIINMDQIRKNVQGFGGGGVAPVATEAIDFGG